MQAIDGFYEFDCFTGVTQCPIHYIRKDNGEWAWLPTGTRIPIFRIYENSGVKLYTITNAMADAVRIWVGEFRPELEIVSDTDNEEASIA